MRGPGFGALGKIVAGTDGAVLGGDLPHAVGLFVGGGTLGTFVTALLGTFALLFLAGLVERA